MRLDPAQRHQIEQDSITAAWEHDDDGDVILGVDVDGHNDLMSRIAAFLATHDQ